MLTLSGQLYAAETPLFVKFGRVTGCEKWVRSEPLPDRGPVLTQLKNLATRLTLLAQIVSTKQFGYLTGSTVDELDDKMTELADFLLETSPNAVKAEILKEQLDSMEGRILSNLSSAQKDIVTAADAPTLVKPSEVNEPQGSNEFGKPMGFKQYGPGQAKP